jgi:hypothetical protein
VLAKSAAFSQRLMGTDQPQEVVRRAYRLLFARAASDKEIELGVRFLKARSGDQGLTPAAVKPYAQALLGSNEFLFVD